MRQLLLLLITSTVIIQLNAQTTDNYKNLDVNKVDAYYMNNGQMFWDDMGAKYEVPKGSGKTPLFAGGLWFTAESNLGIHTSIAKYNPSGTDFFSGPLKVSGNSQGRTTYSNSEAYNKIWKVSIEDIQYHRENYQSESYVISENIATWPAHGNTEQGYAENLAPFIDLNENGLYEPEQGDYPCIKGDMTLYWILNDNLEAHTGVQGGRAMGIEVHVQAYAFNCCACSSPTINYTTFLNWRVINRSSNNYTNFSSGFWVDADIGYSHDDYMGTHVDLNTLYFYNGNYFDGVGVGNEYGEDSPAMFLTMLDGPFAEENDGIDNNNDGIIDEANEKNLLSRTMFPSAYTSLPSEYKDVLNGICPDKKQMAYGYGCNAIGGIPAKYIFPGESDPWFNGTMGIDPEYPYTGGWTEENQGGEPGDRRGLLITGPNQMHSGQELEYTMAIVYSKGYDGAMSSVEKGFAETRSMVNVFNMTDIHQCNYMALGEEEKPLISGLSLYPNPVADSFVINGTELNSNYKIYNMDGTLIKEGVVDTKSIDIKDYPKGIYIVEISGQKTRQTIKLVKE